MSAKPGVAQASHKRRGAIDLSWQDRANCRTLPPDMFSDPKLAEWGLQACSDCPVIEQCAASRRHDVSGIWGGVAFYPKKPGRPRK